MRIVSGFRQSRIKSDEAGYVMVMAILVMVIATMIGVSLAVMGINEYSLSASTKLMDAAYQIAEAGISRACVEMRDDPLIVSSTGGGTRNYRANGAQAFWRSGSSPDYTQEFGTPGWKGTYSASIWQSELMTNDPTYKVVVSTGKISKFRKTAERTIEARIVAGATTQDYDASFDYLIYNGFYGRPWASEAQNDNGVWPNANIWLGEFQFDGISSYEGRAPKGAIYTRGSFTMPTGGLSGCLIHGNVVATNNITLSNNFGISGLVVDNKNSDNVEVPNQGNVVAGLDGTGSATVNMTLELFGIIKVSGVAAAPDDFTLTQSGTYGGDLQVGGIVAGDDVSVTNNWAAPGGQGMKLGSVFCGDDMSVNSTYALGALMFNRISAGGDCTLVTGNGGNIEVGPETAPGPIYCGGKVTLDASRWYVGLIAGPVSDIVVGDVHAANQGGEALFIHGENSSVTTGAITAQGSFRAETAAYWPFGAGNSVFTAGGDITAGRDATTPNPKGITLTTASSAGPNWRFASGSGDLSADGSINVVLGSVNVGTMDSGGAVTFDASGSGVISGGVTAVGAINATVAGTDVGTMDSGAAVTLNVSGSAASVGNISAVGAINATVDSADVGTMGSGGAVTLNATGSAASVGNTTAVGTVDATVNNATVGTMRSGAAVTLTASNSAIVGNITAVGAINAGTSGVPVNNTTLGSLWSGGALTLFDSGLNKTVGDISAGTNAAITANVSNTSGSGGSITLGRISANGNLNFTGTRGTSSTTNRLYIYGIKTGGNGVVTVTPTTDIYALNPWDRGPGTPTAEYSRLVGETWIDFDPVADPPIVAAAAGGTITTPGSGTITLHDQKRESLKTKADHNQQWVPGVDTPSAPSAPSTPSAPDAVHSPWYYGPGEGYPTGTESWFDHQAPDVKQRTLLTIADLEAPVQLLEPNWQFFLDAATDDQTSSGVPHVLVDGAAGDQDGTVNGKVQFLWTSTVYSKNETIYQGDPAVPVEVTVNWNGAGSDFTGTLVTQGDVNITKSLGSGGWRVDTGQKLNIIAGRDIKKTSVQSGFYWVTADNVYYHWWARGNIDFSNGAFTLGTQNTFNGSFVAGNRLIYSDSYLWTISKWKWSRWGIDTNAWLPPFTVLSYREI